MYNLARGWLDYSRANNDLIRFHTEKCLEICLLVINNKIISLIE